MLKNIPINFKWGCLCLLCTKKAKKIHGVTSHIFFLHCFTTATKIATAVVTSQLPTYMDIICRYIVPCCLLSLFFIH